MVTVSLARSQGTQSRGKCPVAEEVLPQWHPWLLGLSTCPPAESLSSVTADPVRASFSTCSQ